MNKAVKWTLIVLPLLVVLAVLLVVFIIVWTNIVSTHPLPDGYRNATVIWSTDSDQNEVELQIRDQLSTIYVSHIPTDDTQILYSDEKEPRNIYANELYFSATEVRFDASSGIIYVMIVGQNAAIGPSGKRIIEYDALSREHLRDYWIKVTR